MTSLLCPQVPWSGKLSLGLWGKPQRSSLLLPSLFLLLPSPPSLLPGAQAFLLGALRASRAVDEMVRWLQPSCCHGNQAACQTHSQGRAQFSAPELHFPACKALAGMKETHPLPGSSLKGEWSNTVQESPASPRKQCVPVGVEEAWNPFLLGDPPV